MKFKKNLLIYLCAMVSVGQKNILAELGTEFENTEIINYFDSSKTKKSRDEIESKSIASDLSKPKMKQGGGIMGKKSKRFLSALFTLGLGASSLTSPADAKTTNFNNSIVEKNIADLRQYINKSHSNPFLKLLSIKSFAKCLVGYTHKKIQSSSDSSKNEDMITGVVRLILLNESHREFWNKLFDSRSNEQKEYLKYYTTELKLQTNSLVKEGFDESLEISRPEVIKECYGIDLDGMPPEIPFMVEYTEFKKPVTLENLDNAELSKSSLAGFVEVDVYRNEYDSNGDKQFIFDYVVHPSMQGKGIATAALDCVLRLSSQLYLQGVYPCKNFLMKIACANPASERVAKKAGFSNGGEIPLSTSNNLFAHKWEKNNNSNKVINLIHIFPDDSNLKEFFNKYIIPFSQENPFPEYSAISYSDFYKNSDKYRGMNGYEIVKNNIDKLMCNVHSTLETIQLVANLRLTEWPVAWMSENSLKTAISPNLTNSQVNKIKEILSRLSENRKNIVRSNDNL